MLCATYHLLILQLSSLSFSISFIIRVLHSLVCPRWVAYLPHYDLAPGAPHGLAILRHVSHLDVEAARLAQAAVDHLLLLRNVIDGLLRTVLVVHFNLDFAIHLFFRIARLVVVDDVRPYSCSFMLGR